VMREGHLSRFTHHALVYQRSELSPTARERGRAWRKTSGIAASACSSLARA
jgi:hypothetical protein